MPELPVTDIGRAIYTAVAAMAEGKTAAQAIARVLEVHTYLKPAAAEEVGRAAIQSRAYSAAIDASDQSKAARSLQQFLFRAEKAAKAQGPNVSYPTRSNVQLDVIIKMAPEGTTGQVPKDQETVRTLRLPADPTGILGDLQTRIKEAVEVYAQQYGKRVANVTIRGSI